MSTSLISQKREFDTLFETAIQKNSKAPDQQWLNATVDQLYRMQERIERTAMAGLNPSGKIKLDGKEITLTELSTELDVKISLLFGVDIKENKGSERPTPSSSVSTRPIDGAVFGNLSANCWLDSLLIMFFSTPEKRAVLQTVADYYTSLEFENTPDYYRFTRYILQNQPLTEERILAGLTYFDQIQSPLQKIKALALMTKNERFTDILPRFYAKLPADCKKIAAQWSTMGLNNALDYTLAHFRSREPGHAQNIAIGTAFQNAITNFEVYSALNEPVPKAVSQDLRLAFHTLKGTFSVASGRHEDAGEAFEVLMETYLKILKARDTFPDTHSVRVENRKFVTVQQDTPARPKSVTMNRSFMGVEGGSLAPATKYETLITLYPSTKEDEPLETLLESFYSKPSNDEGGTYLINDKQERDFVLSREENRFIDGPPAILNLSVQRTITDLYNQARKNPIRVQANRYITLPKELTPRNTPLAYELQSFIAHISKDTVAGAGHFVAYKKDAFGWMLYDDIAVIQRRRVSDAEIEQVLHTKYRDGHDNLYTPHILEYKLVPPLAQKDMLKFAAALRKQPAPSTRIPDPAPIPKKTQDTTELDDAFDFLNLNLSDPTPPKPAPTSKTTTTTQTAPSTRSCSSDPFAFLTDLLWKP